MAVLVHNKLTQIYIRRSDPYNVNPYTPGTMVFVLKHRPLLYHFAILIGKSWFVLKVHSITGVMTREVIKQVGNLYYFLIVTIRKYSRLSITVRAIFLAGILSSQGLLTMETTEYQPSAISETKV